MESLKRPEMIISVATATGLVGSTIYFYKRANALQAELDKLTEHLGSTVRKVAELPKVTDTQANHINQLNDGLQKLNNLVVQHHSLLADFKASLDEQGDEMEELRFIIDNMVKAFQEKMNVTIDTAMPRRRRKKADKKAKAKTTKKQKGRNLKSSKKQESDSDSEDSSESESESESDSSSSEEEPVEKVAKKGKGKGKGKDKDRAKKNVSFTKTDADTADSGDDPEAKTIAAVRSAKRK